MTLTTERPSDQSEGEIDVAQNVYHANFEFEVLKAEEDGDKGNVEAIVSAFNVDYRMGFLTKHRITPNAFRDSIAKQANIPIFFQHNWDWSEQPPIGTGVASTVMSPKAGLKVASSFFLDTEAGRATFRAIKAGALREWSIGYRIQDFQIEENDDGMKVVVVNRAELWEASSVLRGANPDTETLKVARQFPPELHETMERIAGFMQSTTEMFDVIDKRITGVVAAHEILVGSLEESGFKVEAEEPASSGESVEPAASGSGETATEDAAPQPAEAPDSPVGAPDLTGVEPDRIERAYDRALARVASKWESFVSQAGVGLDNPDASPNSREDIASMERVLRCLNNNKYTYDAVERTVTARVLAESASANS